MYICGDIEPAGDVLWSGKGLVAGAVVGFNKKNVIIVQFN